MRDKRIIGGGSSVAIDCCTQQKTVEKLLAPRRNGLSRDQYDFTASRQGEQLRHHRTTDLASAAKDDRGKIALHEISPKAAEYADAISVALNDAALFILDDLWPFSHCSNYGCA